MDRNRLIRLFVLANDFKEGDLAIGGSQDNILRTEARRELAAIKIREIAATPLVDDLLTTALAQSVDAQLLTEISNLSIGELKSILLSPQAVKWVEHYRAGLTSETIAAVVKIMTNSELAQVSHNIFNQ